MTLDQLKVAMAVMLRADTAENPWTEPRTSDDRWQLCLDIRHHYSMHFRTLVFSHEEDEVLWIYFQCRKAPKTRTKALIALLHGTTCYWHGRGMGECSGELEAGHVWPASKGGELSVENGQIECSRHNRDRGTMDVGEYWIEGREVPSGRA